MSTDDGADLTDHDLTGVVGPEHLDELVDIAAVGVQHGEVADATFVLGDLRHEELQRLGPRALFAALLDDTIDDLDDRLDRERGREQCLGVADPATLLEIVEGVEGYEG